MTKQSHGLDDKGDGEIEGFWIRTDGIAPAWRREGTSGSAHVHILAGKGGVNIMIREVAYRATPNGNTISREAHFQCEEPAARALLELLKRTFET